MKKSIFKSLLCGGILLFAVFANKANAQTNNGINFQAVARDNFSNPAKDRKIFIQSSIIQSSATGVKALVEDHETNTDASGVFSISIGQGVRKGGTAADLSSIDWTKGPYFLNIKISISPIAPSASWDYTKEWIDLGTTSFGTVPYALFAGSVAGFDSKLNSLDTAKMLAPYAKVANLNTLVTNKVNIADSLTQYVTPTQLAAKTFDQTPILNSIATKLNIADSLTKYVTPTQLAAKTFDSTAIYNQLALKAVATDVTSSLALKANTTDVTTSLNTKENLSNKSLNVTTDAASDTKYPSVKAVKTYVDSQITNSSIPDADGNTKGKIQIAGDLTGSASAPVIANNAITNAKIATGIDAAKISGDIAGKASNITGNLAIANGGTGATSAAGARTNLGLVIGTDVQAPLSFTTPLVKNGTSVTINQATPSVDGYLSATDFTSFSNKINATEKAANNGVATLGNDGKIPSNQIPAISFQSAVVVNSQNAMLALSSAVVGSIAIRTDVNKNFVLSATPSSTLANWIELATPSSVTSVNGSTGPNVVLTTNDIAEGSNNKYYTDARVRGALSAVSPLSFNTSSGTFSMSAASGSSNGYLSSTDFTTFNNKQNAITAGVDYLAPNGSAALLTNFPTLNQSTTGNAATATKFAAARNINGVAFDGSADITITANASTLTGTSLPNTVTGSSLTSVGTITAGIWSGTTIALAKGGTGATTAAAALTNLGAEASANKSTATDLGSTNPSDILYPSQKAVKTYVDLQSANAGVADLSITNAKLAGSITAAKLVGTDIATVGTITSGVWNGTEIAIAKGGTGATSAAAARTNLGLAIGTDVMAANATTTLTGDVAGSGNGSFTTTVNSVGGVSSATIATLPTSVNSNTSSITSLNTALSTKANIVSPAFTGVPTAPTPATNDNSTTLATTAYVKASITAANAGVSSVGPIAASGNANGATISGSTQLILTPADANFGGVVTTATQTFAGSKTFTNTVTFGKDITVNGMTFGRPANPFASNSQNIAIGNNVLGKYAPTHWTTDYNIGIGYSALFNLTNGSENVAIGSTAMYLLSSGDYNTGIGSSVMSLLTTGNNNTVLGAEAGRGISTGSENTFIGSYTGVGMSGSNNILIGSNKANNNSLGTGITTGNSNTIIGSGIRSLPATLSNNVILADGDGNIRAQHNGTTGWTLGTIVSGTWSGTTIGSNVGGAGTVNGLMKANGSGVVSAAVAGTDYLTPSGNAATATALATGRTIETTGDVTYTSGSFDGSANVTGVATLTNTTVTAGSYGSSTAIPTFTVDSKGRLTAASTVGIIAGVNTLTYTTGTSFTNGGTISGTTLTLAAADATNPGLISTGAQTIAGAKTFNSDVTAANFLGNATTASTAGNITATSNTTLTSLVNLATVGTITSGTWSATEIAIAKGGTGATTASGALTNLGAQSVANLSTNITTDAASTSKYPSVKLIKDYVDAQTASAGVSDGSITNVKLANSTTTLGTTTMTLGGTVTSVTGLTSLTATNLSGTLSGTSTALATGRTISTTGDVTYTSGSFDGTADVTGVATLAASGVSSGTYGSSTAIPVLTVDTKGRVTSASTVGITAGVSTLNYTSTTSYASGGTISGTTLTLTAADPTNPGLVSTGTQTFAGAKTFSATTTFNSDIVLNGITIGKGNGGVGSNLAVGTSALSTNTLSPNNTAIGYQALKAYNNQNSSTSNGGNTAVGSGALAAATSGNQNTAVGESALVSNTSGGLNSAFGVQALFSNSTGIYNTAIGAGALYQNTGGSNTALGRSSGYANTSGSNNTFIGYESDAVSSALTNATAIGYQAKVNANNTIQLGNTSVSNVKTSGTLTVGAVTYPRLVGAAGQVLTDNGSGALYWSSAVGSIGTFTTTSYTNGGTISGTTLTLAAADASNPGLISTGAQTIAGAKTFSSDVTATNFLGNATTATTAGNITATTNTTLTSLAYLATVGTITSGTWSATEIAIAKGGTGAITASGARSNLGLGAIATKSTIADADVDANAAIAFSKLNITKANITGLGVQEGLTAGSGISISAGTISATGLTSSNLASNAAITNAQLANSSTTLGSTTMTLGGTITSVTGLTSLTSTTVVGNLSGTATTATNIAGGAIGAIPYQSAAGTTAILSGNSSSTVMYLTSSGNGTTSAAPSWATLNAIPYTGATAAVNLGSYDLTVNGVTVGRGGTQTSASNTVLGASALRSSGAGSNNVAIGDNSLYTATNSGSYNTSVGSSAGYYNTSGSNNSYYGYNSGFNVSTGSNNSAFGSKALQGALAGMTGDGNQAFGFEALKLVSSGYGNSAIGKLALSKNTTGYYNVGIGQEALLDNTEGFNNIGLGYIALGLNTTGDANIGIGRAAIYNNKTGNYNIGIGEGALEFLTGSTNNNIAIGFEAGKRIASGSSATGIAGNVLIGYGVRANDVSDVNQIVIAGNTNTSPLTVSGLGSNSTLIGNSSTTTARIMGDLTLPRTTTSTTTTSGALVVSGGAGIAENINVGGTATIIGAATISNTTASSSTTTGALKVGGGAGIVGNVNIGGTLGVTGATTLSSTSSHAGAATFSSTVNVTGATTLTALTTTGAATISSTLSIPTGAAAGKVLTSDANGGATWKSGYTTISTKTADYTLTLDDNFIIVGSSATTGKTFTLPTASGCAGKEFTIKNLSAFSVSIATTGSQYIIQDNSTITTTSATIGIEPSNNWIKVISDGTSWIAFRALF